VLLIEDQGEAQKVMELILTQAGASVTSAGTSEEALEAYRKARPDVIAADIGLPDMNGYEFLRRVRALEASRNTEPVPAIALTAYAHDRDRRAAMEAGYQEHVSKPVDGAKLVQTIRKLAPA
jgi:CheY-like chemotaxis protein